jgi:hypothetical protein
MTGEGGEVDGQKAGQAQQEQGQQRAPAVARGPQRRPGPAALAVCGMAWGRPRVVCDLLGPSPACALAPRPLPCGRPPRLHQVMHVRSGGACRGGSAAGRRRGWAPRHIPLLLGAHRRRLWAHCSFYCTNPLHQPPIEMATRAPIRRNRDAGVQSRCAHPICRSRRQPFAWPLPTQPPAHSSRCRAPGPWAATPCAR